MAKTDIPIDIKVSGKKDIDGATTSLADLKKQLKEAQAAALNGDGMAARRVAELRDQLDDLREETRNLQGSGVERIQNSFSSLGEGLANFDWDKIKLGFRGIGESLSAIPVFLIASGLTLLIENFDKVTGFVKDFFGATSQAEKDVKRLNAEVEKEKQITSDLTTKLQNQIRILEAQGGSESKLLQLKKELIAQKIKEAEIDIQRQKALIREIFTTDSLWESTQRLAIAYQRKVGNDQLADLMEKKLQADKLERSKEYADKIREDLTTIQNLKTDQAVEEIKTNKVLVKSAEDKAAGIKEANADIAKHNQELQDQNLKNLQGQLTDRKDAELKISQETADEKLAIEEKTVQEVYGINLQNSEKLRDLYKKQAADQINNAQAATQALQGLSDLVFTTRLAKAQKGSEEELKLAKRQFEINKSLQLATAAINGAQSVLAILSVPDFTLGIQSGLRIAAAIATTAATIAKISATQFQSPGGGGGISVPSVGGGGVNTSAPTTQSNQQQPSTLIDNKNQINVKAYVVETEATNMQNRVKKLKNQATF